jgi:hypothetical protein
MLNYILTDVSQGAGWAGGEVVVVEDDLHECAAAHPVGRENYAVWLRRCIVVPATAVGVSCLI